MSPAGNRSPPSSVASMRARVGSPIEAAMRAKRGSTGGVRCMA
jgi:hypothetical protein